MRFFTTSVLLLLLTGCMSTRISLNENWNPKSKPAYVDYFDFYWWGLSGNNSVSVQKACVDQKPLGFEKSTTLEDMLISVVTLGIYTPVTVKIWCGE